MAKIKNLIHSTFEVLRRSSSVAKLMMKRSVMERERKHKFQRLGELTYSLYKTGLINNSTLSEFVQEIDEINKDIRTSSGEMDKFIR